ncbi:MAG: Crp/Fnr family transcriptional regulator [Clostridiales bacterium]|jgi:CRP/FNR family transcriptional regulator|nr:Crp/Fnr family transcriptional regulator [Clostridiales bacterium]
MDRLWYLSQIEMLEEFTDDENMAMHEMLKQVQFSKGSVVQLPNTPLEGLFFIREGKLRLFKIDDQGNNYTVGILSKNSFFGWSTHFSLGTESVGIEALEATMISGYDAEAFNKFLVEKPDLVTQILDLVSKGKVIQEEMLEAMSKMDLKTRLMYWLGQLALYHGSDVGNYVTINLKLTHEDLAHMIDASVDEIKSNLQILAKEGLIISGFMKISLKK